MITGDRDPDSMTATERFTEIATLLANGYVRLRHSAKDLLAARGESEASCGSHVKNARTDQDAA